MIHLTKFVLCSAIVLFAVFTTPAISEERSAKTCFEEQDRACLKTYVDEAITNPSDDSFDAAYYMGRLLLEVDKDAEEAKKYFEIGAGFGAHKKSQQALESLVENKQVKVEPVDCLMSKDMDCLYNFADAENNAVAQYFLGKELKTSNPEKSAEYYLKAARQGHLTSVCYIADNYFADKLAVELDHKEAVDFRVRCYGEPYAHQDKEHFEVYLNSEKHNAYAASDTGYGSFSAGYINGSVAARTALDSCRLANSDKESDLPCRIVSVDGEWVKHFEPPALAPFKGGDTPFTFNAANSAFKDGYLSESDNKVFVYSLNGAWSWQSSSSTALDKLTKNVLERCRASNKLETLYPCVVVNVNGEWK